LPQREQGELLVFCYKSLLWQVTGIFLFAALNLKQKILSKYRYNLYIISMRSLSEETNYRKMKAISSLSSPPGQTAMNYDQTSILFLFPAHYRKVYGTESTCFMFG
jgi:hypothetical protein